MMAYILLNTKPGTSLQVIDRIKVKTKEAVAAHAIFGRYDAIVVIEAPTLKQINEIVYHIIEQDPTVTRTETSIVLDVV
jgi:DNA-binding Lrp family transcriptional regulator